MVTHFIKCADNIEPTTAEAKNPELTKQRKHKQRNDRLLCNLIFCTAAHCSATFETFDELESHIVKGIHSVPKAASSFDYVKKRFANQMILAARSHSFVTSSPTVSASNAFGIVIPLFRDKNGCIFHPRKHHIQRMRQTQLGGAGVHCKHPHWGGAV